MERIIIITIAGYDNSYSIQYGWLFILAYYKLVMKKCNDFLL